MTRFNPLDGAFLVPLGTFLIIWFTIMGLTGWIASRKGRSSGDWALVALVIGPIALLIILFVPRPAPEPDWRDAP